MTTEEIIRTAEALSLNGYDLDRGTMISLLNIDPDSYEADMLGQSARRVAYTAADNAARVWASIGIDYEPCMMNCKFCSFGADWGIIKQSCSWPDEKVIEYAGKFATEGASWIALRTTENFGHDKLCNLASQVKSTIPGEYKLVANTGDSSSRMTSELHSAGFDIIYHPVRLREGIDTNFDVDARLNTLDAIRKSYHELAFLIEPIGPEHTDEEIVDSILLSLEYGVKFGGAMMRCPVKGTPLYELESISERRLAQIGAVMRLAGGTSIPDICVHPPSKLAMKWGANAVFVDVGAIPRDSEDSVDEWNGFDIQKAMDWFSGSGYDTKKQRREV